MSSNGKNYAISFAAGLSTPFAYVADALTMGGLDCTEKVQKLAFKPQYDTDSNEEHLGDAFVIAGMAIGGVSVASLLAVTAIAGVTLGNKILDQKAKNDAYAQRLQGNANLGAQKVQQAAVAAGLILPKPEAAPQ